MRHSEKEILDILDECCKAFTFPTLDNGYVYLAATRLSLFRSTDDWALVIEIFGFSPRSEHPDLHVYTFGSSIRRHKRPEDFVSQTAYNEYIANNHHNESAFFWPIDLEECLDTDEPEFIGPRAKSLRLRDRQVDIPGAEEFALAGVQLEFVPRIQVYELCRVIAQLARDQVMATPHERRNNVPCNLEQLLTLEEWAHPNVADPDELPSKSKTFQQLARVLNTGDTDEYDPTEKPNTHWKNWPVGGTL